MNQPALALRSVKLPRGSLRELTLAFAPGVHVIVGPNGIGKTSLLNSIAGTLPAVSGSILFDGQPLAGASARVILAPNAPPDIPWIRSGLLLDFVLSLYPATRRDAGFAAATLGRFGLTTFMDAPLGTLSAGAARKLMLASALIAAAPVMLFDEPTNDIDAPSNAAFVEMIGAAARDHIVIVTTHHAQDLASLQPRILDLTAV